MKQAERIVAAHSSLRSSRRSRCSSSTSVATARKPRPPCWSSRSARVGVRLLMWAKRLMHIRDETHPRRAVAPDSPPTAKPPSTRLRPGSRRSSVGGSCPGCWSAAARRSRLAALIPIRSLGRSPGDAALDEVDARRPARHRRRVPVTETTLEVGILSDRGRVRGLGRLAGRVDPRRARATAAAARAERRRPGGAGRVLEDLHPPDALGLYLAATGLRCPASVHVRRARRRAPRVQAGAEPLPQLPIEIDGDGGLRATGDLDPVGPSFWEEGDRPPGGRRARRTSRRVVVHQTEPRESLPDHWSFMLGELALYSFVLLLLTGTVLDLFFVPSPARTVRARELLQRPAGLAGLRVGPARLARRSGRPRDAPDAPLGGARVRRRDVVPRRSSSPEPSMPAQAELGDRRYLLVAGIGAEFTGYSLPDDLCRARAPDHLLGGAVDPRRGHLARVPALRR